MKKSDERADVVIIGGGCVGVSAAYHLCRCGIKNVVVLEKDFLASGATGRCGGGMRQQWTTRGNITLARRSMEVFRNFKDEMGQDIEFIQGGYVLGAFTDEMVSDFEKNIKLQNSLGVPSRFVTTSELKPIVPLLSTDGMLGAAYCATDGKSNPFLFVKGCAERAVKMGCRIRKKTRVTGLKTERNKITTVITDKGKIDADWVINCAGARAAEIAAMAGINVPITPYRHQALVSEPVKPCFDPMFINLRDSIYFSQSAHGTFIMGQTDRHETPGYNYNEAWPFEVEVARKFIKHVPSLENIKIVRHWAGHYAITPDRQPIIGLFSDYENFLIASGFSGHGFMISPATGIILAELVTKGSVDLVDINEFSIERFKGAHYTVEGNVV